MTKDGRHPFLLQNAISRTTVESSKCEGPVPGTLTTHNKALISIRLEGFFYFGSNDRNSSNTKSGHQRLTIDNDTRIALLDHLVQRLHDLGSSGGRGVTSLSCAPSTITPVPEFLQEVGIWEDGYAARCTATSLK